jgi:hypothetical protein
MSQFALAEKPAGFDCGSGGGSVFPIFYLLCCDRRNGGFFLSIPPDYPVYG